MRELSVIPAVIPQSLAHLRECVGKLAGAAREIQIDIVDGIFVSEKSWPYREGARDANIAELATAIPEDLSYELDLMVADLPGGLSSWLAQNPQQVVLHIESVPDDEGLAQAIAETHMYGREAVLALNNDTPLQRLTAHMLDVDGVQCMGIAEIGRQGNPFDERVLDRIRTIRAEHPDLSISVDGSVNKDTILLLKAAGANRFVVGSAIFDTPDPVRAYVQLKMLVSK